jgi:hypothetical protein
MDNTLYQLIEECKQLSLNFKESIFQRIPKLKVILQEECNKLVWDVPEDSIIKAVEAVEFYISGEGLTFDLLYNTDKVRKHREAGDLQITEIENTHDDRIIELFRIKVDQDNISGRFISILNELGSSELLVPMMFEDITSLTFWIDKFVPAPVIITQESFEPILQIPTEEIEEVQEKEEIEPLTN